MLRWVRTVLPLFAALLLVVVTQPATCVDQSPAHRLDIELPEVGAPAKGGDVSGASSRNTAKPAVSGLNSRNTKAPFKVGAESAILIDAATGQILYQKNAHKRRPMASTTKMMTALLVLEHSDLSETVVASKNAACTTNASLHLVAGEKLAMRDLLCGMLIRSANDTCVAAAEHVSGSCSRFVKMMNDKARSIGCKDTHYVNPHGLHDPNQYSTAYDLAVIARKATRFPVFNEIVQIKHMVIKRSVSKDVTLYTHSRFLKRYPGADGIKSGYTKQAGKCYVGSATRDGWRLISVVLHSPDVAVDTEALMDYGFANFRPVAVARKGENIGVVEVAGGSKKHVAVVAAADLNVDVPVSTKGAVAKKLVAPRISAPVRRSANAGKLVAYVDGRPMAAVGVLAASDVGRHAYAPFLPWLRNGFILAIGLMVSKKYGRTVAKNNGGGGRWVAKEMRRTYRGRASRG